METPNYEINYDDERFQKVEADKQQALSELEQTYQGLISGSQEYYDKQAQAAQDYADKQTQLQNEQLALTEQKNQLQKDQAKKDYLKEQAGAYTNYQKQTAKHGVEAEKMAAGGMGGTGFAESSQVSMYNAYQNRVAVAREAYTQAVTNYDISMQEARLQNSAALAQIAYDTLQTQLQLTLQGLQYHNQLILDLFNQKTNINNTYYGQWLDVLNQMNQENALAEEVRQFNESRKSSGSGYRDAGEEESIYLDLENLTEESSLSFLDRLRAAVNANAQNKNTGEQEQNKEKKNQSSLVGKLKTQNWFVK